MKKSANITSKLRSVIYIRVSDESQIKNNSLETQLKACEQYAENNGYEVVEVFREEGVSAKHTHTRPEMRKMLDFCTNKGNRIAAVIVYKMDRWSRNVEEGLLAESLLAKYGIPLIPVSEITEQSPIGKAVRTILMTMGQLDNELKGQRVKDNMKTMFKSGLWCWKPRLGYKKPFRTKEENKGKAPIPDKKISQIITSLFNKAAETTVSKDFLARYMNDLGFEQAYGTAADGRTVSRIIKDSFYYGYMFAPKWKEYAMGKHKPLIDQQTWERANINVFGRSKKYKHQDNNLYPLKGTIKCGNCNNTLTSSNPRGRGRNYKYYECHNKGCLSPERISAEKAHDTFSEILRNIKPTTTTLKLFTHLVFSEWDKGIEERKEEAKILDETINELNKKLTNIAESNAKQILTDEEASERADEIRKEITILRLESSDVHIEQYSTEAVKAFTENFLINLDNLWRIMELPHKQALQSEVFADGMYVKFGKIRTIKLARTFELIEQLRTDKNDLVTLRFIYSNYF